MWWKPFALTIKSKALVNPPAWSQCPWESITASTFLRYLVISSQTKVWATEFVRILPRPDWILHQASPHYRTCRSPLVLCWKMLEFENDIDDVRVNWQNLRRKASFCFFRPWLPWPPVRAHVVHSIENNPKQSQKMCQNHPNWCCQKLFHNSYPFPKYHLKLFHSLAAQGLDFTFEALTAAALWYAEICQFIWYAETWMASDKFIWYVEMCIWQVPCIFGMLRYK